MELDNLSAARQECEYQGNQWQYLGRGWVKCISCLLVEPLDTVDELVDEIEWTLPHQD